MLAPLLMWLLHGSSKQGFKHFWHVEESGPEVNPKPWHWHEKPGQVNWPAVGVSGTHVLLVSCRTLHGSWPEEKEHGLAHCSQDAAPTGVKKPAPLHWQLCWPQVPASLFFRAFPHF